MRFLTYAKGDGNMKRALIRGWMGLMLLVCVVACTGCQLGEAAVQGLASGISEGVASTVVELITGAM
jgi:hypothetical protein